MIRMCEPTALVTFLTLDLHSEEVDGCGAPQASMSDNTYGFLAKLPKVMQTLSQLPGPI